VKILTERTVGQTHSPWADIDWQAVETNVRRLQERIYRATVDGEWTQISTAGKTINPPTTVVVSGR
jgi:hypothetical protein